jgi:gluconate kinase
MFKPEIHIRILMKGGVSGGLCANGLEGNHLVAVHAGNLHPAVPHAVFHVGSPIDDDARFDWLDI